MRPEKMRQIEAENRAAMLQEADRQISPVARRIARQVADRREQLPKLSEEEKRRKALEFQAKIQGNVTQGSGQEGDGVIPAPGTLPSAAKGVRGGAEAPLKGQKIADSSAATRAPQTGGRWPTGPQSNGRATGSSAPEAAARAADPEIPERLKTKPNRKENEFMMNLMILRNTMKRNAPACRERARLAGKWVWRDIRLLTVLVERIQEKLLRTMPESRDDYYRAYAQHGHYELHMDGPVRTARHILMTDKHAAALAEAAMKSECILCIREGSEIGQCPLREALLESAVPTAISDGDSLFRKCEYRDAAGKLIQGKDVSI